jgi:parvulin-like peptidyl-prolyl isomerase
MPLMSHKKFFFLIALTLYLGSFLPIRLSLFPHDVIIPRAHAEEVVVAAVNGDPILKLELDQLFAQYMQKSGDKNVTDEDKRKLISTLVARKLILQQPECIALRDDKFISQSVKNYEESLIVNRFVREYVDANVNISDDDLRMYYNTHQDQFSVSPKIEARVILLRTQEEAENILEKLHDGEDFAKLVENYSIDLPSARKGGSLGVKGRGEVFPQIWRVIVKLKEGEISDIVETEFGYNILTVDKIVSPEEIKPFQEVKTEIRRSILPRKREKVYDEMLEKLEKSAKIEIFEDRFFETSKSQS